MWISATNPISTASVWTVYCYVATTCSIQAEEEHIPSEVIAHCVSNGGGRLLVNVCHSQIKGLSIRTVTYMHMAMVIILSQCQQ
jgi:hypothetical protein